MSVVWEAATHRPKMEAARPSPGIRLEAHPNDHISPKSFNEVAAGHAWCFHVFHRTSKPDDGFLFSLGSAPTLDEAKAGAEAIWRKSFG